MPAPAAYDMRKDELVCFVDDQMVDANCGMTWCEKLNTFYSEKQPQTLMYMKNVIRAKYNKDRPWLEAKKKYNPEKGLSQIRFPETEACDTQHHALLIPNTIQRS